ncbi:PREDICTED: xyloglucan endotransglucosylase/hydrolase protein 2-like [Erythranthe guttata]|nr:PREDICTED: xyloglucan endotransglucosylase/hydrolase protein 2-like [Erythranthe guttata]|eukprot:XP_012827322.1 PREDICTED: xyloglucan endotransglucosylase/hydrolase protein 2-like [Erythranthe guttata]
MAFIMILTVLLGALCLQANASPDNNFDTYYSYLWGGDHFSINPQKTEVQLKFDNYSGAGFYSKSNYGSGLFHIKMKIPANKSGGIVPNFYLMALPVGGDASRPHFEVDFEFLGSTGLLQTNVYNNDTGGREQKFQLWFDASADYHTYEILWNPSNIQ